MKKRKRQAKKWRWELEMEPFAEILKMKLDRYQMTAADLHRVTGLRSSDLSRYLNNQKIPNEENFQKLNDVLNFSELEVADYRYQRDLRYRKKKN